jgi:hypothetical protein
MEGGLGNGKGVGAPLPTDHKVTVAFAEHRRRFAQWWIDFLFLLA